MIGVPYVWLLLFFVLPFLILLRISVTDMCSGVDPFAPLIDTSGNAWRLMLEFKNYLAIFSDGVDGQTIYVEAYKTSSRSTRTDFVLATVVFQSARYETRVIATPIVARLCRAFLSR